MGRGDVILEVEYEPVGIEGRKIDDIVDNYDFGPPNPPPGHSCWQFAVFVPIPIDRVKRRK